MKNSENNSKKLSLTDLYNLTINASNTENEFNFCSLYAKYKSLGGKKEIDSIEQGHLQGYLSRLALYVAYRSVYEVKKSSYGSMEGFIQGLMRFYNDASIRVELSKCGVRVNNVIQYKINNINGDFQIILKLAENQFVAFNTGEITSSNDVVRASVAHALILYSTLSTERVPLGSFAKHLNLTL